MSTSLRPFPRRTFEQLHRHLQAALNELCPDDYGDALSLDLVDPPAPDASRAVFRLEGPDDASCRVTLELFPTDSTICGVRAETDGGHSRHFRFVPPQDGGDAENLQRVARWMATFLLNEIEQRRDCASSETPALPDLPPHMPVLVLDEKGLIQTLTRGARRVLQYSPDTSVEPNFFSHVHGQNLRRVMQDLAHMVSQQKQSARWLLRMQTGNRRWRWYRARADNHVDHPEGAVRVLLRPLSNR